MIAIVRKIVVPAAVALGALASFPTIAAADVHGGAVYGERDRDRDHERAERERQERFERERRERERLEHERFERERRHAFACEQAARAGASWYQLREMRCIAR